MKLTDEQIEYIANNLKFYGVKSEELKEDLLDHICTYMETGDFTDFDTAYKAALKEFGGHYAMGNIQRETYIMTTFKKNIRIQRLIYITGYIVATLISTGFIFKMMHWPGASILLTIGFAILILMFLPVFFYRRYKSSERKLYE